MTGNLSAYVTQLRKNYCCAMDLTNNVMALGLAITQLSSIISQCLDSIEDQLENEPPLEPINYAAAAARKALAPNTMVAPMLGPPVITWN